MTKKSKTAPFLIKLQTICSTIPEDIAHWNKEGTTFQVSDSDGFFAFLQNFFSGTPKTFFRQLSYFRFTRSELLPSGFAFSHEHFKRDDATSISNIKRFSPSSAGNSQDDTMYRINDSDRFSKLEEAVFDLRNQVSELSRTVVVLLGQLKRQSSEEPQSQQILVQSSNSLQQEQKKSKPTNTGPPIQFEYFGLDDFQVIEDSQFQQTGRIHALQSQLQRQHIQFQQLQQQLQQQHQTHHFQTYFH